MYQRVKCKPLMASLFFRFQERVNNNSKLRTQYAQISSSVKKEGGAIVKAVKSKVSGAKITIFAIKDILCHDWIQVGIKKKAPRKTPSLSDDDVSFVALGTEVKGQGKVVNANVFGFRLGYSLCLSVFV